MSESKKQNHDRSALNEVKRTRGRPRLPDSERKAHVTICLPPNVVKLVKSLSERSGMGFGPVISQALSEHFASELEQEAIKSGADCD